MMPRNLLKMTAVRLALRYALLYAILTGVSLSVLYWLTSNYVDSQLSAGLEQDYSSLLRKYDHEGILSLIQTLDQRSSASNRKNEFYLLVDKDSHKLSGNLIQWPDSPVELDGRVHIMWLDDDALTGESDDDVNDEEDKYWPLIAGRLADGSRLLVAHSIEQSEELQLFTLYVIGAILTITIVLALAMGINMGTNMLRRIDLITATVDNIMSGDLSRRVTISGKDDEFDALGERLNAMLDRIQQLVKGIREVTDNVAHDLRAPLSRLQNNLEVTLLEQRSTDDYRHAMEQTIQDARDIIRTFNALLEIAQAEAGSRRAEWSCIELSELARDLTDLYAPLAEEKGLQFELKVPVSARIDGIHYLLAQAISNLLDNAIKYSTPPGKVRLQVDSTDDKTEIIVSDSGPGIPATERERVLKRFVRLDKARHTPGNGLGLSLVNAVANLHGAKLLLNDANPGLRIILRFPKKTDS